MKTFSQIIAVCLVLGTGAAFAQQTGTADSVVSLIDAVNMAVEHNFEVQIARNNLEIVENNNRIGQAGLLPRVDVGAAYDYSRNQTKITFADPSSPEIEAEGAATRVGNANVTLSYNIFSGGSRLTTYKLLQNDNLLSELELRRSIELTVLNVMEQYFNAVLIFEEVNLRQESVLISLDRLERAEANYAFGSFSKVELLNAEVDLRNDSTDLINSNLRYQNALKVLNNAIGIDPSINYDVDRMVEYEEFLDLGMLLDEALQRNSNYLISRAQLTQSELDIRLAKSNYFPSLDLQAGYGYSNSSFDANFLETNRNNGWNTGVSLSYNIFNGGQTRRAEQNAKIQMESSQVRINQTENQLKTDILTSFNNFETNKDLLALNVRNLELAEANYSRSQEAFATGEITGLQLREAQLNLLSSKFTVSQLRVQTKASELNLYYLSGTLVDRAP